MFWRASGQSLRRASQMVCGQDLYGFSSMLRCLMSPERVAQFQYGEATTVVGGIARGITMGGNLSLLASSIGTDTSWPARGGIAPFEDTRPRLARRRVLHHD